MIIDKNQLLADIIRNVTAELGAPWTFKEPEEKGWSMYAQRPDGAKLYFSLDGPYTYNNPSRVNISGSINIGGEHSRAFVTVYEKSANGTGWERATPGSISVAIERGAAVIAKEIKRRLLPEYERVFALAVAQVAADKKYKEDKASNLQRLATASGVLLREYQGRTEENFHVSFKEAYGLVTTSNNTATIELRSLTIEQAELVLRALRGN